MNIQIHSFAAGLMWLLRYILRVMVHSLTVFIQCAFIIVMIFAWYQIKHLWVQGEWDYI